MVAATACGVSCELFYCPGTEWAVVHALWVVGAVWRTYSLSAGRLLTASTKHQVLHAALQ
jgi:hypothetical protein